MSDTKPSYLSVFSHELKSPLNAIINLAKLIELNLESYDEAKIKKYLRLINAQALYLKTYIANIIDLGKLQTSRQELIYENFDLVELLYEIAELTKILKENKPIKIETLFPSEKCLIFSDPIKIKQILLNIASNSAKFTKQGKISFSLKMLSDKTLIEIEDTGIGIPKGQISKLFNPYCSLESSHERLCESSGLGLYITKELINMLGGDISIESEYGKGTKVLLSIPAGEK